MKWLIIQSDGEHKGQDSYTRNDYLRECYAIKYALELNKCDVDIWGKRHSNFNSDINFNKYDYILCIENYELDWLPDLSSIKCPKLYWIIDLHCQDINVYKKHINCYDLILHSTKSLINKLQYVIPNKKHIWFPNGVDDRFFIKSNLPKIYDFLFVGNKNIERKHLVERLEKEENLCYKFATGIDMINYISQAKIHFNKSISCDINYRNFETIGLGTCLLTNDISELRDLGFEDKENCLMYSTYEEIIEKYKYGLKDNNYERIGNQAAIFAKEHSYSKRIKELLRAIK